MVTPGRITLRTPPINGKLGKWETKPINLGRRRENKNLKT